MKTAPPEEPTPELVDAVHARLLKHWPHIPRAWVELECEMAIGYCHQEGRRYADYVRMCANWAMKSYRQRPTSRVPEPGPKRPELRLFTGGAQSIGDILRGGK